MSSPIASTRDVQLSACCDFLSDNNGKRTSICFNETLGLGSNSSVTEIQITIDPELISLEMEFNNTHIHVEYRNHRNGCSIEWYKNNEFRKKLLENRHFGKVFCGDIDMILKNQNSILELFEIELKSNNEKMCDKILNSIHKTLETRSSPLQIKKLGMNVSKKNHFLTIIPHIDMELLESVKVILVIKSVSSENISSLKEAFFKYPSLKHFELFYKHINGDLDLVSILGQPFIESGHLARYKGKWFLRIPDANQALSISTRFQTFCFERFDLDSVPPRCFSLD